LNWPRFERPYPVFHVGESRLGGKIADDAAVNNYLKLKTILEIKYLRETGGNPGEPLSRRRNAANFAFRACAETPTIAV
jgi:hypothetical protein